MGNLTYFDIAAGCVGVYLLKRYLSKSSLPPLPPGPKGKPIIGNLLDLPQPGEQEWVHWAKHKELYGPISSVTVMGQTIIILNSLDVAIELLDKKSAIFSDRPVLVFGGIMVGWENSLPMLHYGERFRQVRKNLHQTIGSNSAMRKYYDQELTEVRRFLIKALKTPNKLFEHIRSLTGALVLSISHGYQIEHEKLDPLVELGESALLEFAMAAQPGAWLVDVVPFLRYLPDWFPGTEFKRTAKGFAHRAAELVELPHEFAKRQINKGVGRPCLTQELMDNYKNAPDPAEEYIIKWSTVAIYGGGADTTVSATFGFFLLMMQHPEVQRAAQEELDSVVGLDRLPSFDDRPNLPYINALVKELLRFAPVVPMGLPHVGLEDHVYNGYHIPKGAILLANIWNFHHDPTLYKDPNEFRPERFLGEKPELDTHSTVFGFGRRICPGKELADTTLFLTIAMTLAVYDICEPLDASGKPIKQDVKFIPGLISKPEDYEVLLKPRSSKAEALINSVTFDHPFEKGDSDVLMGLHWEKQTPPFPASY